jgi:Saxitoxin biosynthesis operon protein SxtJ
VRRRVAMHERIIAQHEVRGGSDRAFGIVFASFFTVVGVLPTLRGGPIRGWSLAVAVAFLAVAVWRPALLAPFNRFWTWIGWLLHRIVNPLVMGFIFYTTITPIGLLLRLAGHDLLKLNQDRDAATYWIERRPPGPAPETMRRQF